jgi:Fur family transcriptional regulator, peroxide stress response regulator
MDDATVRILKEIGLKITPQRQAILRFLDGNKNHPSADSIYSKILKEYPAISFATVYNTLSKLASSGKIQELDIDPGRKRFDPCTDTHSHFYCKTCGNVFDVVCNIPFLDPMDDMKTVEEHRVDTIQLNFKGLCRDCAKKHSADNPGY